MAPTYIPSFPIAQPLSSADMYRFATAAICIRDIALEMSADTYQGDAGKIDALAQWLSEAAEARAQRLEALGYE